MPQLTRWRLRLQDFDFALEYLPGAQQTVADGLSRIACDDKEMLISMSDILPYNAAAQSLLQSTVPTRCLNSYQCKRNALSNASTCKSAAERVWESTASPHIVIDDEQQWTQLPDDITNAESDEEVSDTRDTACFNAMSTRSNARVALTSPTANRSDEDLTSPSSDVAVPVIPLLEPAEFNSQPACAMLDTRINSEPTAEHSEQGAIADPDAIIGKYHSDITGHGGVFSTLQRVLKADAAWAPRSDMIRDIDAFLSNCICCQKYRKRTNRRTNQRFVIQGSPFAEISVDVLKLPSRDCNGNLYIVVIIDSFSRWVSLEPTPDKSALSAARAILKHIGNFGVPITIRSDGGKEFINDTLAGVEHLLGTKHHRIAPYHHEGNSLAERANRAVLENLRNLVFDGRYKLNGEHQWSDLLPLVQRIVNASFNSSIGCSPAQLVFGDGIDLDRCLISPQPTALHVDANDYVRQLAHNQRILLLAADAHLHAVHAKNIRKWKASHKSDLTIQHALRNVSEDEPCWVVARIRDDVPLSKLKPRWAGPFRLLDFKTDSQSMVRLFDTVSKTVVEAHLNDVELWNTKFESSTEGLSKIAEFDNWEYPMDAILGIAVDPNDEEIEPIPLPLDRAREFSNTHKYLFAVKWRNYTEPSWVLYSDVCKSTTFTLFAAAHPALKL